MERFTGQVQMKPALLCKGHDDVEQRYVPSTVDAAD